ncbi:hypothetical protein SAMN06296427_10864 [Moheibacter sediminis]|uniref:Uncharacterized protein n=1 Tax=Moheibacter sediminis TaxID=1434700 RepID=A0A1W2C1N1_9FLAO|nr:hypothetical protein SAMN06296427_10864 [Moheibacter sediminis]
MKTLNRYYLNVKIKQKEAELYSTTSFLTHMRTIFTWQI